MKTLPEKLRLILLPFLLIAGSFILLYTFLNWLLFIQFDTIHVQEDVVKFWLPFALPWIPVLLWLRPRIRLLNLKKKNNDNLPFLYQFVAVGAIAASTIVAQEYLATATGKLQVLQSIKDIGAKQKTKYYNIQHYYLFKEGAGQYNTSEISGKNNSNLIFHTYYALPLFDKPSDTSLNACQAWLGVTYLESMSNSLSDSEKEERWQQFAAQTQQSFDALTISSLHCTERVGNTKETKGFLTAVKNSAASSPAEPVVLKTVEGTYARRNGDKLSWTFGALAIGSALFLIMILIPSFDESEKRKFLQGVQDKGENDFKDIAEVFRFKSGYKVTPLLLIINILLYVVMVFAGLGFVSFGGGELLWWDANFRPFVLGGEWWRLLTSTFLHGGIMHLLSNMIGLAFIGRFLEAKIGTRRFSLLYLLTGLLASLVSIWWHPATVSVGASGAIFGMQGVFLALLLRKCFPPETNKVFLTVTLIFIGYNLLMGLAGGIDNAAHVGGLVSGFIAGLLLSVEKENRKAQAMKKGHMVAEADALDVS